jgi:hypothetical protein
MTNSEPSNSSISEPAVEPGDEQESSSGKAGTWLEEVRFLVAAVIIFVGIIEYKVRFPNQNRLVDILAFGIISSLVSSVVVGIPVYRAIAKFVRTVLEVPWS